MALKINIWSSWSLLLSSLKILAKVFTNLCLSSKICLQSFFSVPAKVPIRSTEECLSSKSLFYWMLLNSSCWNPSKLIRCSIFSSLFYVISFRAWRTLDLWTKKHDQSLSMMPIWSASTWYFFLPNLKISITVSQIYMKRFISWSCSLDLTISAS